MRLQRTILAAILACSLTLPGVPQAHAQERCVTWSEARSAGLIDQFQLRPASQIKAEIEKRHKGKVVSFQICKESDGLIYRLAVYKSNGDVLFLSEPAEPLKKTQK